MNKFLKRLFLLTFIMITSLAVLVGYGYWKIVSPSVATPISIASAKKMAQSNQRKIKKAEYDGAKIDSVGIDEYMKAQQNRMSTLNQNAIGSLAVSSINLNLPVLAGISEQNLLTGTGTYRANQRMGKSNYVLMSHNLVAGRALLHNIDKIKSGALIYLTDWKNVYIYKVNFNEVVYESEVSYLDAPEAGKTPLVTLLRCEGGYNTPYRRIVQGKLTRTIRANPSNLSKFDISTHGPDKFSGLNGFVLFSMNLADFVIQNAMVVMFMIMIIFSIILLLELFTKKEKDSTGELK